MKFVNPFELPKKWDISPGDRILVLAPHPDDESIGCGGMLIKHAKQCDVILLTNGCFGNPEWSEEKTIETRAAEFERAMTSIGVKSFQRLPIKDLALKDSFEEFSKINLNGYSHICIPHAKDIHPDHIAVYPFTKKLMETQKTKPKLACYEIWSAISAPSHYIDISDVIERKKDLIDTYKSQLKHINYTSRVIGLNHYRGILYDIDYAEVYEMIGE